MLFKDRRDAGKKLLEKLTTYSGQTDVIVLGLPRGGIVTASEIASGLGVPLDVACPRKIGAPFNPELALGAVTETGEAVFNEDLLRRLRVRPADLQADILEASAEAARRSVAYRKNRPPLDIKDKVVIIVDDGLATGATMKAAIASVRKQHPKTLVVAIPVSPPDTLQEISEQVDEVYCLYAPFDFQAVGQFYRTFDQTSDSEVIALLDLARKKN